MNFGWKRRVLALASAIYSLVICVYLIDLYNDIRIKETLTDGVAAGLPLIIVWGIVWVYMGWKDRPKCTAQVPEEPKSAKGVIGIVITVAMVCSIGIGWVAGRMYTLNQTATIPQQSVPFIPPKSSEIVAEPSHTGTGLFDDLIPK